MADCAAHDTEKVECPAEKCTKKAEETHSEAGKPEVTEDGDGAVLIEAEKTEADDANRKRKSEALETDKADGADDAKKVKTTDDKEETNGDKEENGKDTTAAEEETPEVTKKTAEDVQRLVETNEEVAA